MGNIMENGNPRDSAVLLILAILIVPGVLVCLWTLTKNWLERVDNLDTDDKYLSKYTYFNKCSAPVENKPKGYKKIDRERPPNASFFCRVEGKETFIEGPYEEKFLTRIETIKWEVKKRRRDNRKKKV